MKLKITKIEKFKQKNGNGEASIIYATTNNGNEIMIYDYSSQDSFFGTIDNRKYLYAVEPWNYYNNHVRQVTIPYNIESFEKISTEDVFEKKDIKISGYQFEDPTIGWSPSENVKREYKEKYSEVYQEIGEAYDLDTIGTFEQYCPAKYKTMIEREDITDEQKDLIKKIAKMRAYCDSEETRTMLDEKIEEIITGKAIIAEGMTHKQGYRDVLDSMSAFDAEYLKNVTLDEFTMFGVFKTFERPYPGDSAWPFNGNREVVRIMSMCEREVELPDGRRYKGTFGANGRYWDVCVCQDGRIDIDNTPLLLVDRFDVETGSDEQYKEYNQEIKKEKQKRIDFYIGVMKRAREQFGLTNKQAKELLEFAGTVSALDMALELDERGLTTQQAEAILRKISYNGVDKVLDEAGIEGFPGYKFDIIQSAAATLIHHRDAEEIADGIEPTESGMKKVEEEMVSAKDEKAQPTKEEKPGEEFGDNN